MLCLIFPNMETIDMTQFLLFHALFITLSASQSKWNHFQWKVPPKWVKPGLRGLWGSATTRAPCREDTFIHISILTDANTACSYLPELFIQVRGVHQCPLLYFFIIHLLVPGDEEGAQELLHLYCNVHGDRDNKIEEDHKGQEVCEHPQDLQRREKMQPVDVRAQR